MSGELRTRKLPRLMGKFRYGDRQNQAKQTQTNPNKRQRKNLSLSLFLTLLYLLGLSVIAHANSSPYWLNSLVLSECLPVSCLVTGLNQRFSLRAKSLNTIFDVNKFQFVRLRCNSPNVSERTAATYDVIHAMFSLSRFEHPFLLT